jgi:hypothetical protein
MTGGGDPTVDTTSWHAVSRATLSVRFAPGKTAGSGIKYDALLGKEGVDG